MSLNKGFCSSGFNPGFKYLYSTLKYAGVKGHRICRSFSEVLEKKILYGHSHIDGYTHTKGRISKGSKMLVCGESGNSRNFCNFSISLNLKNLKNNFQT